jgi:pimeloyl-ACP methyl ester carboxylesterase
VRSLITRSALTGGIAELALVGAHMLIVPAGHPSRALRPDLRRVGGAAPPAVRALFAADPLAARVPVVLGNGLIDNHSIFAVMRRSLRRRGFTSVCSWNYSPFLTDVARGAADLGEHLQRVCEQTGHERVHVVGHSLGGLLARYHVQRQGGDQHVETLVTLGTPHQGSVLAHLLPTPLVRQLRTGLGGAAGAGRAGAGRAHPGDGRLQRPRPGGRPDQRRVGATTRTCRPATCWSAGVGHMSLPFHRGVLDEVATTLAGVRRPSAPPAPRRQLSPEPLLPRPPHQSGAAGGRASWRSHTRPTGTTGRRHIDSGVAGHRWAD